MSRRRPTSAVPSRAYEVLGPSHPLACASWRALHAVERVTGAAIFGGAGTTLLLVAGHAAAPSFAIASAIVTTAAGLAVVAARASLRAAATDAIAVGDDHVGVHELDLMRRRLTSRKFRTQLAHAPDLRADTRARQSPRMGGGPSARPAPRRGRRCPPSVHSCEANRRQARASSRAAHDSSLAGHDSPLFGDHGADSAALDRELRCIRYHADSSGYEDAIQAPEPPEGKADRSDA